MMEVGVVEVDGGKGWRVDNGGRGDVGVMEVEGGRVIGSRGRG